MDFKKFKDAVSEQFEMMEKNFKLFKVDCDKSKIWEKYLDSFPPETNGIYREREYHNCQCCKQFIQQYGNVIAIDDYLNLISIWDITVDEYPYDIVANSLSKFVKLHDIRSIFISSEKKLGVDYNVELNEDGSTRRWNHFYYELKNDENIFNKKHNTLNYIINQYDNKYINLKNSMESFSLESGEIILDLIAQNSLYKGVEFKNIVETFIKLKKQYNNIEENKINLWFWKTSNDKNYIFIKNTVIGTLIDDISKGINLNDAVKKYEDKTAPENYKRPKPIITTKMIEDCEDDLRKDGCLNSIYRRHAKESDISVNDVIYADRNIKPKMKNNDSVFDEIKNETQSNINIKKFDKVEEVNIETFINDIVPTAKNIKIIPENRHENNFMNIVAPVDEDSPTLFKWDNKFSWTYKGNITDSSVKRNVKKAGGNVNGKLRFSLQWNDDFNCNDDLDAHCYTPNGGHIYYSNKKVGCGELDIDIVDPMSLDHKPSVENIIFSDKLNDGVYKFSVKNYDYSTGNNKFKCEIEFNGQIWEFSHNIDLKHKEEIEIAKIEIKGDEIKFISSINKEEQQKMIYNIKSNEFHDVSMIMKSPNYWDDSNKNGNKHYFFILKDCKTENNIRGIFNEYLKEKYSKYKRQFELLGEKTKIDYDDEQLAGLGFSVTKKNHFIAKIESNNNFNRTVKVTI